MQKRELDKQQLRSASGFRARLLQRADNFIVVALSHPSDVEHRFYTSDILRRGVGKQPMLNYAPLLQHRSLGIDEALCGVWPPREDACGVDPQKDLALVLAHVGVGQVLQQLYGGLCWNEQPSKQTLACTCTRIITSS
jgi:hypothetical protein